MIEEPFPWWIVILGVMIVLFVVMAVLSRSAGPKAIWGRLCTHCGMYVPSFAKFCPHCGRRADGPSQQ